jgi:hypothetical protein
MSPEQIGPIVGIGVAVVLIVLRNRAPRTLRPQWLWVAPVLVTLAIGFGLWGVSQSGEYAGAVFGPDAWAMLAAGLVLGALAGWWRAKGVTIFKTADGGLKAQASPLGILLILGLFVARSSLKVWLGDHAEAWHINALALTDAFMLFAVGLVVAQRAEMYIRARRILSGGTDAHLQSA